MLSDYLGTDNVEINVEVDSWQQAVEEAGKLLLKKDLIEPDYIEAMQQMVEENGAYIVISPGLALPHARPEDGVVEKGLSCITLKEPVKFGHPQNDPVQVVIGFCAVDDSSHVEMMSGLANFLTDKKEALKGVNSKEKLIELIQNFDQGGETQ